MSSTNLNGSSLLPTRRELTLLLFAFTVFLTAYNFEASIRPILSSSSSSPSSLSSNPSSSPSSALSKAFFSARSLLTLRTQQGVPVFRDDGRRRPQFSDDLEQAVVGDWDDRARPKIGLGPAGVAQDQQHREWRNGDVPVTELVAYVPGYTILDNVLLLDGTLYFVHDHAAQTFPKPEGIISHGIDSQQLLHHHQGQQQYPTAKQDLKFLTRHQALDILGYDAHRLPGVTVLCLDHVSLIDNQTLLSLHRAYSSLSSSSPSSDQTFLPPARTIFPNLKYTSLPSTGYDIRLSRLAFPYMTHLYADDWTDLDKTGRPVVFDRVLISDRVSAEVGGSGFDFEGGVVVPRVGEEDVGAGEGSDDAKKNSKKDEQTLVRTTIEATDRRLSFAPAFALPAPADWASPLLEGVSSLFSNTPSSSHLSKIRGITYISTQFQSQSHQHGSSGARLREADHEALIKALRGLEASSSSSGVEVNIIELGETGWVESLRAVSRSQVMLGVYGGAVAANAVLMSGSGNANSNSKNGNGNVWSANGNGNAGKKTPMVIEFFPDGRFTNELEFVTRAVGVEYVVWRNTKKYTRGSLPPISPPTAADSQEVSIDVDAVVRYVKEQLR